MLFFMWKSHAGIIKHSVVSLPLGKFENPTFKKCFEFWSYQTKSIQQNLDYLARQFDLKNGCVPYAHAQFNMGTGCLSYTQTPTCTKLALLFIN